MPKNTMQCPWTGLEPRLLNPKTEALTMRSPRPLKYYELNLKKAMSTGPEKITGRRTVK